MSCSELREPKHIVYTLRDDPLFYIFHAFAQIRDMFAPFARALSLQTPKPMRRGFPLCSLSVTMLTIIFFFRG